MENEKYMGLVGEVVGRYWCAAGIWATTGSPARVAFDPYLVIEQERQRGNCVGFFHTHPNMAAWPSSIDHRAMIGWTLSFGKPMVCCIHGVEGIKAHWYIDDESDVYTSWVKRFGDIFVGRIPKKVQRKLQEHDNVEMLRNYFNVGGRHVK